MAAAINVLQDEGPVLGRPLVDTIKGSSIKNLKELRPGSSGSSEIRILFVFDPWRQAILLVAGDKSADWKGWYTKALKDAERLYAEHLQTQEKKLKQEKVKEMAVHKWDEVKPALFAGQEEEIGAAEEQLRAEVRAYRLAEVRKARHLTQQQVAAQMGVTTARVSQIEHGQVDRAAIRGLAGYVEALGGRLELVANFGDERIVIGLGQGDPGKWQRAGREEDRIDRCGTISHRSFVGLCSAGAPGARR